MITLGFLDHGEGEAEGGGTAVRRPTYAGRVRVRPALTLHRVDVPSDTPGAPGRLADVVAGGGVVVLSGAGLSTDSGIPDYRGPTGTLRRAAPMTYEEFTSDVEATRRYWARSHLGWRTVATAEPNAGHHAVATLQRRGLVAGVVTQNVDGLHQAAGSTDVLELHGGLQNVVCLGCRSLSPRRAMHGRLAAANPGFEATVRSVNADGDVDIDLAAVARFRLVACPACGEGPLKPDVVFFGENVPPERVRQATAQVDAARALLVLGSSLTVMSGYRFVLQAMRRGIPVVIASAGPSRGDEHAAVRLTGPLGTVLPDLVARLGGATGTATPVALLDGA